MPYFHLNPSAKADGNSSKHYLGDTTIFHTLKGTALNVGLLIFGKQHQ